MNDLLAQGKRLEPPSRRELVRVVVDEVLKVCPKPLKKHTDAVAQRIVDAHPASLCDKVDGEVLMGGFQSLAKQLKARVENLHRKDSANDSLTESESATPSRKRKLDFGCVNPEPTDMPLEESEESLHARQVLLTQIFEQGELAWQQDEIEEQMKITYILQRKDINRNVPIPELLKQWPFLFQEFGTKIHFELLMEVKMLDCLKDSGKVEKLWAYLKTGNVTKYKQIFKVILD